ncbi:uncharacterized protein LOC105445582 [Strongylocentrotus purpuratus]|uniref:Uncharacterized protein n=1 Tax=Strongylocentrotus purpuratus TaxID=7668 RepID=A0A7M7P438_STRPU|nr:uncharacterized protein LOC105445582 [Strongylocentrotus purpuratus]
MHQEQILSFLIRASSTNYTSSKMATSTQLTVFITLAVMAITGVYGQLTPQSQITQMIGQTCTVYRELLKEEGPKCSHGVIEEFIDELDNVQPTMKNVDADTIEDNVLEYLKQSKLNSLCYVSGMSIRSECELMDSVCSFGNNIIKCRDLPPAAPANPPNAAPNTVRPATT